MRTSRRGRQERADLPCPADADSLARAIVRRAAPDLGPLHVVTGRCSTGADRISDLLRGGATTIVDEDDLVLGETAVLPGTQSRWAVVENGRIMHIRTCMTGERFAVLGRRSAAALDRAGRPGAAAGGRWRIARTAAISG